MRITQYQQPSVETDHKNDVRTKGAGQNTAAQAPQDSYFAQGPQQWTEQTGRQTGKGKSLIEIQQAAENIDVEVSRDYMTLMSNTMSEEDYAKMQEKGFDFSGMDPKEAVTIVDKIKAELVRAGKNITGYTDDLDMEALAEVLGSDAAAQAVAKSFQEADLPLTRENLDNVARAWTMAQELEPLDEGSMRYLIDNEMEPEIWNLYLAQNSGAGASGGGTARFYQEDVQGYYTRSGAGPQGEAFQEQIDRIIEQSGRDVDETSREDARWLLEKGLPLTGENLDRMEELKGTELPASAEDFGEAAASATARGIDPVHGSLSGEGPNSGNLYERAVELAEYYQSSQVWEDAAGDITARRQLEEIRLRMTAEVNLRLLKSGFSIDTEPMEKLVEALKQAESQLARQYFPDDEQAVEKYRLLNTAENVIDSLPGLPAQVLGTYAEGRTGASLEEFHREGRALQETYAKAGESYEALGTAPRADMGDSIRKAFANVDDILRELGLEPGEENRRAVRILGYNRMEITQENLEAVMEADRQVQSVINRLNPAAVLKMIRDDVNPLEKSFEELEEYFDSLPEEYHRESESYSRFLYGLEKNKAVTEQERESYIGIYRLVRQIEKSDGAVVGALVNTQAQLHFSNLLSAVRSGKVKSLDRKAEDQLGTVTELVRKGESISDQIGRAFVKDIKKVLTEVSHSDETVKEYNREQLEEARKAVASAEQEVAAMLQRGELPANADHLAAARALVQGTENLFDTGKRGRTGGTGGQRRGQNVTDMSDSTKTNLTEMSKTDTPEAGAAWEEAGKSVSAGQELWRLLEQGDVFEAEYAQAVEDSVSVLEEAVLDADSSMDVRRMQLWHKQLTVAGSLAKQQEFFIPMYIGDTLSRVHLTLDRGSGRMGTVDIGVHLSEGDIHARFGLEEGRLQGIFTAGDKQEVMNLQKIADTFRKEAESSWTVGSISIVTTDVGAAINRTRTEGDTGADNGELFRVARVFLETVRQGETNYED